MEDKTKKGLALGVSGLVGVAAGAGAVTFTGETVDEKVAEQLELQINELLLDLETKLEEAHAEEKEELVEEYESKIAELEAAKEGLKSDLEEAEGEVIYVDNENLQLVLEHLFDKDGNVSYLTDDLLDDELDQIVDRIVLLNEIESDVFGFVNSEIARYLERYEDNVSDRRDISRVRIDRDSVEFVDTDFYNNFFELNVDLTLRHEGKVYKVTLTIEKDRHEFYIEGNTWNLR